MSVTWHREQEQSWVRGETNARCLVQQHFHPHLPVLVAAGMISVPPFMGLASPQAAMVVPTYPWF